MRVSVYDRYWSTLGGGEKFAGGIAQVLVEAGHQVDLIGLDPVDVGALEERLALSLPGVGVRVVGPAPGAVAAATEGDDLFVNASYQSADVCRARAGIYVVHFPAVPGLDRRRPRRVLARTLRQVVDPRSVEVTLGDGFHHPNRLWRHIVRWTSGEAAVRVAAPPGDEVTLVVSLGRYLAPGTPAITVEALVEGQVLATATVRPPQARFDLDRVVPLRVRLRGRADGTPVEVLLRSPTFVPAEVAGDDDRALGVPVVGVEAGRGWAPRVAAALPALFERAPTLEFLDSYDLVASNSEFTRTWVERLWGRSSEVLNPPVTMYQAGAKAPEILSVGRFFGRHAGHSKKQLEMVQAFRRAVEGGLRGWSLHLVGGTSPEHAGYVEDVRRAARGLSVELHLGLSGRDLARRYASASLYWHAAGFGEDPERHPDRFEHFGITTAEAMSAGAVPVVYGAAGQREVVRDGVDGYHFRTLDDLARRTVELAADDGRRGVLAEAAQRSARRYAFDAFGASVLDMAERVTAR